MSLYQHAERLFLTFAGHFDQIVAFEAFVIACQGQASKSGTRYIDAVALSCMNNDDKTENVTSFCFSDDLFNMTSLWKDLTSRILLWKMPGNLIEMAVKRRRAASAALLV
jgi:hypothetical protein